MTRRDDGAGSRGTRVDLKMATPGDDAAPPPPDCRQQEWQRKAPIASLEDLDSPTLDNSRNCMSPLMADERNAVVVATTTTVVTPATPAPQVPTPAGTSLTNPRIHTELQASCLGATPRIDISRASSSSQHDDSSPERELAAGGESSEGPEPSTSNSPPKSEPVPEPEPVSLPTRPLVPTRLSPIRSRPSSDPNTPTDAPAVTPTRSASTRRSPKRGLEGAGGDTGEVKMLGFMEEGTQELRSSTEELHFTEEPGTVEEQEAKRRADRQRKRKESAQSAHKYELEAQSEKERKDSTCSADIAFLSISGRTSRLSSIGSAASAGSGVSCISAVSQLSGMSHLSATSHLSGTSRSPSPYKMLLETSFCGNKSGSETGAEADSAAEKVLLSRQKDPTKAAVVVENGRKPKRVERQSALESEPQTKKKDKAEVKKEKPEKSRPDETPKKNPARVKKKSQADPNALVRIIPLHSTDDEDVEVEEPQPEPVADKYDIEAQRRRLQAQESEDLEGQRRKWEEARAKAGKLDDEESDLVKIIPLRGDPKKPDKQKGTEKSKVEKAKPVEKAKAVEKPKPVEVVAKVERAPAVMATPTKSPSPLPPSSPTTAPVTSSSSPAPEAAATKRPKRKVDPNALVRIIPLRPEDSYEGYGEEDLPAEKAQKPTGEVGVDAIEVDMSTWREPSFEESDLVKIIPLKVNEEELAREKEREEKEKRERERRKHHTPHTKEHRKTKEPSRPKESKESNNDLVRIIPLHSSDEEISERERELKKPREVSELSKVDVLGTEDLVTITPLRRQSRGRSPLRPEHVDVKKECSLTRQKRCEQSKPVQDDLVRVIPLHSPDGSGSEAELAGYAAKAKRQSRKQASRPTSRPTSRPPSRNRSPSPAQQSLQSARFEKEIEPLQIVSLSPEESESVVAFQRRDLAIQGGHSRQSPTHHDKVDFRTAEQTLNRLLGADGRRAKPATLELVEDQKGGRSVRQGIVRRGSGLSGADVSRTPSPPNTSNPPSRKSSISSLLLRRTADSGTTAISTGAASPESPGGPRRRLSALLKDAGRPRSRSRSRERDQRDRASSPGHQGFGGGGVPTSSTPSSDSTRHKPGSRPDSGTSTSSRESRSGSIPIVTTTTTTTTTTTANTTNKPTSVFSSLFRKRDSLKGSSPKGSPQRSPQRSPQPSPQPQSPASVPAQLVELELSFSCAAVSQEHAVHSPGVSSRDRKHDGTPDQPKATVSQPSPMAGDAGQGGHEAPTGALLSTLDKNAIPSEQDELDTLADSSESADFDPDAEPTASATETEAEAKDTEDHETKGLVPQQDSFEEELPYVPTTLPLERSVAVPIVPVKQRVGEVVRTCPIERPRSTTPINPSLLDEYVAVGGAEATAVASTAVDRTSPAFGGRERGLEKLRISLPRDDSIGRSRSPQRRRLASRPWADFAALQRSESGSPPPPLPPRAASTTPPAKWINFDDLPEKRKAPVRIQTIPTRGSISGPSASPVASTSDGYARPGGDAAYVNPEDCRCECHEASHSQQSTATQQKKKRKPRSESTPNPSERGGDDGSSSAGQPFSMDLGVANSRRSVAQNDLSSTEGTPGGND